MAGKRGARGMDSLLTRSGGYLLVAIVAALLIAVSADFGFSVHLSIIAIAAMLAVVFTLRNANYDPLAEGVAADQSRYDDHPIRWGVIATVFWGVPGLAASIARTLVPNPPPPGAAVPYSPELADRVESAQDALAAGRIDQARAFLCDCLEAR